MPFAYRGTAAIRRLLTRRPWLYWCAVCCLAAALATAARSNLAEVGRARDSWGETTHVWVATAHIEPGDALADLVERRFVARAMVPDQAVPTSSAQPAGRARQRISPGEIITIVDITSTDDDLALVPIGWLAVVIDESPRSGAAVGSAVQLAADGIIVAKEALVIGDVNGSTLLAVPEAIAPLIPVAAALGTLTVLRVP